MSYQDPVVTLDLPELFEGAFVKLTNPILLPWEKARDARRAAQREGGDDETVDRHHLAACVLEWNIPNGDKSVIPLPITGEALLHVPWMLYTRLVGLYLEKMGVQVPNGEAPSSPPSRTRSRGTKASRTRTTSTGSSSKRRASPHKS